MERITESATNGHHIKHPYRSGSSKPCWTASTLGVYGCIFIITYIAVGMRIAEFGFYEDDFWSVAPWLDQNFSTLASHVTHQLHTWSQGRPLNHTLPQTLGYIAGLTDTPQTAHLVGLLVLAINGCLLFHLLRRWFSLVPSLFGSAFYLLFPADTTRLLPIHMAEIQGGMTILLAGSLLYFRSGRWLLLSYPVAALALLAYESTYLPFLVLPIADSFKDRRHLIRRILLHLVGVTASIVCIAIVRFAKGDSRTIDAAANSSEMLWRAISAPIIGGVTIIERCFYAPIDGLRQASPIAWASATVGMLGFAIFLVFLVRANGSEENPATTAKRPPLQTLLFGIASVLCSYLLTLINYPPNQIYGRFTSTHIAAAFGASIVISYLLEFVYASFRRNGRRVVLTVSTAYLLGLALFAGVIQSHYAYAWRLQKDFWRSVVRNCPTPKPGAAIIVLGDPPTQAPSIGSFSWADTLTPSLLFDSEQPPELVIWNVTGSNIKFEMRDDGLYWTPRYWTKNFVKFPVDSVTILRFAGTGTQCVDSWIIPETTIRLASVPSAENKPKLKETKFVKALVGDFSK